MSRAVDTLINLRDQDKKELRSNVTNALLQAILEQLEKIEGTLECLQHSLVQPKSAI